MDTNILQLHHSHVGTLGQTKWELQPVCLPHSKRAVQSCRQGARTQALITVFVAVQTPVSPVSQIMSPNPRPTPYHVGAQGNKPVVKADFVTEPGTSTSGSAPVQRVPHAQLREESLSASPLKLEAFSAVPLPAVQRVKSASAAIFNKPKRCWAVQGTLLNSDAALNPPTMCWAAQHPPGSHKEPDSS